MTAIYIIVYVLTACFFIIDRLLRKGDAKALKKTEHDKGSTALLGVVFVVSCLMLIAAPVFNYLSIGQIGMSPVINAAGLVIMSAGLVIRIAAMAALGRFYMRTLRETEEHRVVSNGIYALIRHPGYLGILMFFLGSGIAMGNIITFIVLAVLPAAAYSYRIKTEEKMLIDIFGDEYRAYMKKTKKLIPFIY